MAYLTMGNLSNSWQICHHQGWVRHSLCEDHLDVRTILCSVCILHVRRQADLSFSLTKAAARCNMDLTLVLLVIASSTADKSEMSTKVVLMLHFAGRKDLNRANVPPAQYPLK